MKHFGDITKIDGHAVPIVDIITGGSPCQDLSVAGKRAGLAGERSGLFMEQIRIIKEMHDECRRADVDIRPRYMVWENVPGAFSSNGGADFQAVLEETAKVAERDASIPRLEKWPQSGAIMGNGWSIAWRVHDAQFWGVPQRRKRIALVADFRGASAPEILFERKCVSGDTPASGKAREEAAGDTGESAEKAISFQERAGKPGGGKGILIQNERTGALSTLNNQPVCYGISAYESNAMKSQNPNSGIYKAETSRTLDLNGGSPACNQGGMAVVMPKTYAMQAIGEYKDSEQASSIKKRDYKDCTDLVVGSFYPQMKAESQCWREDDKANTLVNGTNPGYQNGVCIAIDRAAFNQGQNAQYDFSVQKDVAQTIVAKDPGGGISETVGALCARDYKGVGNEYVEEHKVIVCHSRPCNTEN